MGLDINYECGHGYKISKSFKEGLKKFMEDQGFYDVEYCLNKNRIKARVPSKIYVL